MAYRKISAFLLLLGTTFYAFYYFAVTVKNEMPTEQIQPIVIAPLNGNKDIIKPLLAMHGNEYKVVNLENILENDQSNNQALPCTFVAYYNGKLAGSCSLEEKCTIDPTLSPWANHLFVEPEFRGKKIAQKLIEAILKKANELGYPQIFFWTDKPDNISIYQHFGGSIVKKRSCNDKEYTIMSGSLDVFTKKSD